MIPDVLNQEQCRCGKNFYGENRLAELLFHKLIKDCLD